MLCCGVLAWYAWVECPAAETMRLSQCNHLLNTRTEVAGSQVSTFPGRPGSSAVYCKAAAYIAPGVSFLKPDTILFSPGCTGGMVPGGFCRLDGCCSGHTLFCSQAIQVYIGGYR